jgi:hypothetical protein
MLCACGSSCRMRPTSSCIALRLFKKRTAIPIM